MPTTMTITVDYDSNNETFSFALSYTDSSGTVWTGSAADGDTVAFINDGQYTLKSGGTEQTFTFDAVDVVLGAGLGASQTCTGGSYSVSSIGFPTLPREANTVTDGYQWCQAVPTMAQAATGSDAVRFVDPQLGLSNSRTDTPASSASFGPCSCSN